MSFARAALPTNKKAAATCLLRKLPRLIQNGMLPIICSAESIKCHSSELIFQPAFTNHFSFSSKCHTLTLLYTLLTASYEINHTLIPALRTIVIWKSSLFLVIGSALHFDIASAIKRLSYRN